MAMDDLKRQAVEAAKLYRERLATVAADGRLSPQGKAEAEAEATALYRADVARIQGLATARIDRQRAALPEKRQTATLRKAAELQSILSEATRFALLQQRIARMTGIQLVQAARNEGDDWALAVMLQSGRIQYADDQNVIAGLDAIEAKTKWGADVVQVEAEARAIEADAKIVPLLDVVQARHDAAGRLGVREEYLPANVPFEA